MSDKGKEAKHMPKSESEQAWPYSVRNSLQNFLRLLYSIGRRLIPFVFCIFTGKYEEHPGSFHSRSCSPFKAAMAGKI